MDKPSSKKLSFLVSDGSIREESVFSEIEIRSEEVQGTHQELTYREGAYYELVKNQLELGN